jgi:hypothetical protein
VRVPDRASPGALWTGASEVVAGIAAPLVAPLVEDELDLFDVVALLLFMLPNPLKSGTGSISALGVGFSASPPAEVLLAADGGVMVGMWEESSLALEMAVEAEAEAEAESSKVEDRLRGVGVWTEGDGGGFCCCF